MCGKEYRKSNEKIETLNQSFVWGAVTAGSYYTQAAHITNIMDIPTMSANIFRNTEKLLGSIWEDQLTDEINKVGQQEKAIALEKGNINQEGIPFIEVYVDGGWAKRSYGHDYSSSSGMACIIGKETKKCLFVGIKNKYCYHCHMYQKDNKDVPSHFCFKNYQGPSTGMEAAILVEGFQKSEEMHGLQYLSFVGDGDSSVFAQLKEKVSYGRYIKKIECKNHVIKNYTSALYKILANKKLPLYGRRLLKAKIQKLTVVTKKIIMQNHSNRTHMREDLKNGPSHVFGHHDNCKHYYCKFTNPEVKDVDNNLDDMKQKAPTVWALICAANEMVITKTHRLSNETTNCAENFMSIVSKFNCGKRLNLHKGGSYQRRVYLAGLTQITGQRWHQRAWHRYLSRSPGLTFKKYIERKEKSKARQQNRVRRRLYTVHTKPAQPDKNYGPDAQDVVETIEPEELKKNCLEKLSEFQKTIQEIKQIAEETIGQHENDLYNLHRCDRLTASNFGMICKRRNTTPCHNHVKQILYKNNIMTNDMTYGQRNESMARTFFIENYKKSVRPSGLYIDEEFGFLGASPDGIVENERAILEIKCFPSLARNNKTIEMAAKEKKLFPLKITNGMLEMNKTHNYYYQVQGQLRVTKMEKCYFIGFVSPVQPITVLEVTRDEQFISDMLPKLITFYKNSVLPEIILRRISKGARCIECTL
ncbi:uncharacterized protein LOC126374645 [Pectinophora gossypiella]|uniref:uncharacterized protein LOC126374645 n=1 Tax=Pectinophora gossypiella TaxID=13191 RepID=UPI00214F19F4|nr:uncharacterized protein LOC126374645 [Pectinophora gossypiella]